MDGLGASHLQRVHVKHILGVEGLLRVTVCLYDIDLVDLNSVKNNWWTKCAEFRKFCSFIERQQY